MRNWSLVAREVFTLSQRHWVVVWGELKGDQVLAGDELVVSDRGREVIGTVEGIEIHRLTETPESWVGIQIGGPAAEVVRQGSEVRSHTAMG